MLKVIGTTVGFALAVAPAAAADLTGRYIANNNGAITNVYIQETPVGITGQLVGSDVGSLTGKRIANGWHIDGQVELLNVGTFPIRLVDFGPWGVEFTLTGNNGPFTLVLQRDNSAEVVIEMPPHSFLLRDVETFGPVSAAEIASMLESGELNGNSFAWTSGLMSWTLVQDIPQLAGFLPATPERPVTEAPDPLQAILGLQLAQQLGFYNQIIRDRILACGMEAFQPLSPADRQVLIDTNINPPADFVTRNPGVMEKLLACADPSAVGGPPRSSYTFFDGRTFAVSGPEPHTLTVVPGGVTFTVGDSTFTYADGKLTSNGEETEIEDFDRSLEVKVTADGETATLVYDQ